MSPLFFPDNTLAWLYYLLLVAGCVAAVVTDVRWQRIPNFVTVPLCLVGLLLNLVRASWLGWLQEPGRFFGLTDILGGLVEGFCFSLAGFAVAFAIFVVLRLLNKCGGGDVKLMAAVGTWIGPYWFFFVFVGTIIAVIPVLLTWWVYAYLNKRNPGLKLSYALPACLSVALFVFWFWRKALIPS